MARVNFLSPFHKAFKECLQAHKKKKLENIAGKTTVKSNRSLHGFCRCIETCGGCCVKNTVNVWGNVQLSRYGIIYSESGQNLSINKH